MKLKKPVVYHVVGMLMALGCAAAPAMAHDSNNDRATLLVTSTNNATANNIVVFRLNTTGAPSLSYVTSLATGGAGGTPHHPRLEGRPPLGPPPRRLLDQRTGPNIGVIGPVVVPTSHADATAKEARGCSSGGLQSRGPSSDRRIVRVPGVERSEPPAPTSRFGRWGLAPLDPRHTKNGHDRG